MKIDQFISMLNIWSQTTPSSPVSPPSSSWSSLYDFGMTLEWNLGTYLLTWRIKSNYVSRVSSKWAHSSGLSFANEYDVSMKF